MTCTAVVTFEKERIKLTMQSAIKLNCCNKNALMTTAVEVPPCTPFLVIR